MAVGFTLLSLTQIFDDFRAQHKKEITYDLDYFRTGVKLTNLAGNMKPEVLFNML